LSKQKWELDALTSLEFFKNNPEYKSEFGHQYFADRFGVSRMTLSRNKKYMKRFNEVKEILKGVQLASSTNTDSRITSDKEKIEEQKATIAEKNKELEALKLRLNDCYQMLEDQGIDPQFVIRPRLKKHKEA
jgi:hypothetical protein